MDKVTGFIIVWGIITLMVGLFLLWTYSKSGEKWLKNL